MKKILRFIPLIFLLLISVPAIAAEFAPLGTDAMSMGGAGVACTRGSYAPYYNPAMLAEYANKVEVSLAFGAGARDINIVNNINTLSDLNLEKIATTIAADPTNPAVIQSQIGNINSFVSIINDLGNEVNGFQLLPDSNLGVQIKQFGIGIYTVSDATATAIIDPNKTELIFPVPIAGGVQYYKYQPDGSYSLTSQSEYMNKSFYNAVETQADYIDLTGLVYEDVPLSGAYQFNTEIGKIDVGGSIKLMSGLTLDQNIYLNTKTNDLIKKMRNNVKQTITWGVDIGVAYVPKQLDKLTVGLVAKNLNTPSFDTFDSGSLKVDPQVRLGGAYEFLSNTLTVAADLDITNNKTYIPGYTSQYLGGGVNYHPSNWGSIRAGIMQNFQRFADGPLLTVGFSAGPKWLQFDFALMSAVVTSKYQDVTLPSYIKFQLGLTSKW